MTRARCELVDLDATPYYHCICRCVRRAFLCGEDHLTGKSFEHRKAWVVERLSTLSSVFAIDVAAYAVMSNHYHIVLRVDRDEAQTWTEEQVMRRWKKLFKLPLLIERYRKGVTKGAESTQAQAIIALWRTRLMDLSWYMRSLNEHLARRANKEDQCKGRFWEGRYKSQALLDEAAVLTCMSYVDLNPIRAGIAEAPETSDYTSIQQRIAQWRAQKNKEDENSPRAVKGTAPAKTQTVPLMRLIKQSQDPHVNALGYSANDYLTLVDWAGRAIRAGKRGAIAEDLPPILERLHLDPATYLKHVSGKAAHAHSPRALGAAHKLRALANQLGQRFIRGTGYARELYLIQ